MYANIQKTSVIIEFITVFRKVVCTQRKLESEYPPVHSNC